MQEVMGDDAFAIGACASLSRWAIQFSFSGFLLLLAAQAFMCEGHAQGIFELIFFSFVSAVYVNVAHVAHVIWGSPPAR